MNILATIWLKIKEIPLKKKISQRNPVGSVSINTYHQCLLGSCVLSFCILHSGWRLSTPMSEKRGNKWKHRRNTHTHTHKNDTIKLHREPCKVWFGSIVTLHLSCSWFSPASFSLLASGLDSGLVSALHSDGAVAITTKKKKNKKFGGFLKERIRKRPKGWLIKSLRTQNRRILTERKREKESVQMLKKKQWNWRLKVGGRERGKIK